jgi:transposase
MGSRRKFTKELKQSVVQQIGTRSMAELCREHNIDPNVIYRWKREYETSPNDAFKGNGRLWKEDAKIAQYERLIGQLYAQIELLKKSNDRLLQLKIEEQRKRRSIP